jgi:hypothetical protein
MAADGAVSAGTTATLICQSSPVVTLRNTGGTVVTIGGPGVTAGVGPVSLPANMLEPVLIDAAALGLLTNPIYGIVAVTPSSVTYHSQVNGA